MITAIKAELRKLRTVRSTYVLTFIAFGLLILVDFWATGYKAGATIGKDYVQSTILSSFGGIGVFAGIVGVLLVTNEYRYNTIYYALTSTTSRLRLLAAKWVAAMSYILLFTVATVVIAMLAVIIGLHLGNHAMPAQTYDWAKILGWGLFYMVAGSSFGLLFAVLIRNQIGTIVVYLLAPGTIEALASLVLKQRTAYLPFTALGSTISEAATPYLSRVESALVVLAWLVVGWVIAAILFVKRDAN